MLHPEEEGLLSLVMQLVGVKHHCISAGPVRQLLWHQIFKGTDRETDRPMNGWMDRQMCWWMEVLVGGWGNGWMDRRMDGWLDE